MYRSQRQRALQYRSATMAIADDAVQHLVSEGGAVEDIVYTLSGSAERKQVP